MELIGLLDCRLVLAFDHFDADRSGFIDKAEFAQLSADLGELLDDEELSDAVKEIDSSNPLSLLSPLLLPSDPIRLVCRW
jgi:hypothetical protein